MNMRSPPGYRNRLTRIYHPNFIPAEIEYLSEKQWGKQSVTQEEKVRQSACTFLETIGTRVGFEAFGFTAQHTIAAAQAPYHRFHQFFPRKDFHAKDVALAALYISTKEHNTLKKSRELLAAQRLLAVERLILKTICFNFTARMPFPYVIKLGQEFKGTYRTLLPSTYSPHTMALGSIFVTALLLSFEQTPFPQRDGEISSGELAKMLHTHSGRGWEGQYLTRPEDLKRYVSRDFAQTILDLLIQYTQNPSANAPPSTSSFLSPNLPTRDRHYAAQQLQYFYKANQLIRLKFAMRETEPAPRRRKALGNADPGTLCNNDKIGQNEDSAVLVLPTWVRRRCVVIKLECKI
ncbi:hypothetical protein BDZ97DRAFT_1938281 [Flammula alnicola]|nr:hypothetical protein BDZ97DRAFT_1938281 [Flammula alnicola]